jgi:hypothetical protein
MKRVRLIGVAVLLVGGVALCASAPASAEVVYERDWGTVSLTNVSPDEPQASCEATFAGVAWKTRHTKAATYWYGELTMTCHGLWPRTQYWSSAGTFRTDRDGEGSATGDVLIFTCEFCLHVGVVRVDKHGPETTVLEGTIGSDWGTHELTSFATEPDPDAGAFGEASLTEVNCPVFWGETDGSVGCYYTSLLTVKCQNLTPGQTYTTPAGTLVADNAGKGEVSGPADFEIWCDPLGGLHGGLMVDVIRDTDGTVVLHTEW